MNTHNPNVTPHPNTGPSSKRFFYGGIIVGFVLVVTGLVAFELLKLATYDSRTILYSGIGVILGAFGSTATLKYKGITVAGVAAITIVLLYVVTGWVKTTYIEGIIKGDVSDVEISVIAGTVFANATDHLGSSNYYYRFLVPKGELKQDFFEVEVVLKDPEGEFSFLEIDKAFIEKHRGRGKKIEWKLDIVERKLFEANSKKAFADAEDALPLPGLSDRRTGTSDRIQAPIPGFFPAAHAQEPSTDELLRALESPNSAVRRNARRELAAKGSNAVPDMIEAYRAKTSSYRMRLGVLVALTEMLRTDKTQAKQVSARIDENDLDMLVRALAHYDRTMRIYAAEFLYDLGDTRIVDPALQLAENPNSFVDPALESARKQEATEQGRYLAIFVIAGAYPHLKVNEKSATACAIHSLLAAGIGDKTEKLIHSIGMAPADCEAYQ